MMDKIALEQKLEESEQRFHYELKLTQHVMLMQEQMRTGDDLAWESVIDEDPELYAQRKELIRQRDVIRQAIQELAIR